MKRWMVLTNVLGGVAVLGSYALGFTTHTDAGATLWGGGSGDFATALYRRNARCRFGLFRLY